jgi:hypothetical protein
MEAMGMAETADSALALYVDPQGIMPSNIQRTTSTKHPCFFPPGKSVQIQFDVCHGHHLVMLLIVNHL